MAVDKRENGEKMELSQAPVLGSAYTHNFYGKCIMDIEREVYLRSGQAAVDLQIESISLAHQHDVEKRERQLAKRVKKELSVDEASPLLPTVQALTKHEVRNYSLSRAIRYACQIAGGLKGDSCLESEISASIADDLKVAARGLFLPLQLRPQAVGQDANSNAAGKYLVTDQLRDLIDYLRPQTRLTALGATWLTGLRQPASFAIETSAGSASWVSENSGTDVTQSDLVFGLTTLRPKTLQATSGLTRQLLTQSSLSLDARIAKDLTRAHAAAIEVAAIAGSGSSNQPLGILQTPGINTVSIGASGGVPTYDIVCQIEQAVADKNADFGSNGFLSTPGLRKKLRVTYQNGAGSDPVWQGDTMLEKTALVSTAVPSNLSKGSGTNLHALIFANWSELVIAQWSVLDILADPYRLKKTGVIEITTFGMIDIGIMRPASFAVATDCALS